MSGGGIQESVSTDSPLILLVTALLSGGFGTGVTALWKARRTIEPERDNLIVGSAQTALLSMKDSLAAETERANRAEVDRDEKVAEANARADRAERERDRIQEQSDKKDARIAALEGLLDQMQDRIERQRVEWQTRLDEQSDELDKMRRELHEIRTAT